MTLTEYMRQETPVKMPNVILSENEYCLGTSICGVTPITILDADTKKPHWLMGNYDYVLKHGSKNLYSTDTDGNPKNITCFSIN